MVLDNPSPELDELTRNPAKAWRCWVEWAGFTLPATVERSHIVSCVTPKFSMSASFKGHPCPPRAVDAVCA